MKSARKLEIGTQSLELVYRARLLCLRSQVHCTPLPLNMELICLWEEKLFCTSIEELFVGIRITSGLAGTVWLFLEWSSTYCGMNNELPLTLETGAVSCLSTSAHCLWQFLFIHGLWKTLVEGFIGLKAAGIAMPDIFFCSVLHLENKQILFALKKKDSYVKFVQNSASIFGLII